jgi:hypothetical protein
MSKPLPQKTPPFKKGQWVGDKDDSISPIFGTVRDCYPEGESSNLFLLDLYVYNYQGVKVGRRSPAMGGPSHYEPCISAERFKEIEEPNFPLKFDKFSRSYRLNFK